jgi:hypothetical protein
MHHGENASLRHATHRTVDGAHEAITAVELTPAIVNAAVKLTDMLDTHATNTAVAATTVAAGMKYGIVDNFLACRDRHVTVHIKPLVDRAIRSGRPCLPMTGLSTMALQKPALMDRCSNGEP